MPMNSNKSMELEIRTIAASIIMKSTLDKGQPLKYILSCARKLGISAEELISELNRRFESVGLKLRTVRKSQSTSDEAEVFVVIDPELKISVGMLDRITCAVLALIYIKAETQPINVENIVEALEQIVKDRSRAKEIFDRTLRKLEKSKLVKVDHEKKLIELTSKALAILPEREDLESMLIEVIS
ncbi:MAG: hypothetical protein NDP16_03745 [Crenarchaeota archaeon]|nr:hypothetical protein [Thermoproteota archaeon]